MAETKCCANCKHWDPASDKLDARHCMCPVPDWVYSVMDAETEYNSDLVKSTDGSACMAHSRRIGEAS